ncbi:MAG: low molecular weight phosphotyrosine protein phosphatase [Gammaproteobacteria bacterium]|nr:low molecular weight phosphotyrosine protein phosphatase [Gammaproteobacteria bacterium]
MMKVLFVCMGNICRSPTAQGVFEKLAAERGMLLDVMVDSAGTHAYHVGEPPDHRSQAAAERRDVDISGQRARQVTVEDFDLFDLVIAMDRQNLMALSRLCPPRHHNRLRLFMDFGPAGLPQNVPDPYYGGTQGFEDVLDIVEAACHGLLDHIQGSN